MKIFLNTKLVPASKALVSVRDHGFLYGDGVYETMRVYRGKVFLLQSHLRRLNNSLLGIRLSPPMSLIELGRAVESTVRANRHFDGVVRLTVTRGAGPYGFDPRPCKHPTVVIESYPFEPYPPHFHKKGITAAVVRIRRNNPASLPPSVKSTSCMNGILAKMASIDLRAQEGILLTLDGHVAEGTVSNLFVVKNQAIFTPALDGTLLPGVTRDWVCGLARAERIDVWEERLPESALVEADEIFLTNTTMEVLPVSRLVSEAPLAGGLQMGGTFQKNFPVGPVTRRLQASFTRSLQPVISEKAKRSRRGRRR